MQKGVPGYAADLFAYIPRTLESAAPEPTNFQG